MDGRIKLCNFHPENYEQRLLNYEIHTEKGW